MARSIDEIEAEQKSRKDSVKLNFVPNKELIALLHCALDMAFDAIHTTDTESTDFSCEKTRWRAISACPELELV